MRPIIGITTFQEEKNKYSCISNNYIYSISAAGGVPVCIPLVQSEEDYDYYINVIDGIVFPGGVDVAPKNYGEEPLKEVRDTSPTRDESELKLFARAYEKKLPILGICRGSQLINVALGGSLYQDINNQLSDAFGHSPSEAPGDELYHSVNIVNGSRLHAILGTDKLHVNSFHHQAVKGVGRSLTAAAYSNDNIIEATESTEDRFLLGIQWHPECLTIRYPLFLKLFRSLVKAADEHKLAEKKR